MALTKKATDKYLHVHASTIAAAMPSDIPGQNPIVEYMSSSGNGNDTLAVAKECEPIAWMAINRGLGRQHPELRKGLKQTSRYHFIMLLDKDETTGKETVVGAHAIPDQLLIEADMAAMIPGCPSLAPEDVLLHIRPDTGEIDIHVISPEFEHVIPQLIAEVEKVEEINYGDSYKCGSTVFEVQDLRGNLVTLRGTHTHDIANAIGYLNI